MSIMQAYKEMGPEDRAAVKELQAEETARTGKPVSLSEILAAVTPGEPDPAYLLTA